MDGASIGLSAGQAADRLRADGPNVMPPPPRRSAVRRFLAELTHFFAIMLWAAAVLAFVARLPQLGIAIVAVVLLNAVFSFIQENRADKAAERLNAMLPSVVTVIRDGRRQDVDAREVVIGDALALSAGDRVPADGQVLSAADLRIDASMLTGESEPARVADQEPVFAGTFVVEGEALALVDATGSATRLARIARLTADSPRPVTPLARELRRVVRTIAVIALAVGGAFFAVAMLLGETPSQGLMFAIGVTVALVPEALLPTVTLTLAWGAEQMARRQVLVRDLEAVETLGSTTIICTDKTGTLTRNQMTVVHAWMPEGTATVTEPGYLPSADVRIDPVDAHQQARVLAEAAVLCSDGYVHRVDGVWVPHGDPMEAAVDVFGRRLGLDTDALRAQSVDARFPFDPRRRRMSVVDRGFVLVKGAPDAVLPLCADTGIAATRATALAERGLRVIAVAMRACVETPSSAEEAEAGVQLLGLLALEDPPRPDVRGSLEACRTAGIAVIMVTGDHPGTAASIATEVGLRTPDDPVLVGADLPADQTALGVLIDHDGLVIARVSPEDKLRIATALRARGHVVAMTGDGVNDVPALHASSIGIAMGESGTDVAREAADLVLLDDHFGSIVAGIEQGRATFANIRRFLTYHLTDNVAELTPFLVWGLSGGSVPLALGVLQILALDIGTDTMSAVALGAEPPARHLLADPPQRGRLLDRTVLWRAFGVLGPTEAVMSMLAFLAVYVGSGWWPGDDFPGGEVALAASGAAFLSVVLSQAANAFACRSARRWPGALGWTSNRLLIPAIAIGVAFSVITVVVPSSASALGQTWPTPIGWVIVLASPVLLLAVDAADKARRRSRERRIGPGAMARLGAGEPVSGAGERGGA